MEHVIEAATSGRAKCRGCGHVIEKCSLRFGERVENPYNDKETTLWFHPDCAAFKRPESFLDALGRFVPPAGSQGLVDREALVAAAERGVAHRRLARLDRLERAASGRATCRHCRQAIAKDALRIRLVYFEAGRFEPSGFIHVTCAGAYCESTDILPRVRRFTEDLDEQAWEEARVAIQPDET